MKCKIPFNKPYITGNEFSYIEQAIEKGHLSGNGMFTKKCHNWLESYINCQKAMLTHSCTAALEMAAILADIRPGDEVIMPSYTFVSTANAFVLRGGVPVFVDIRTDTLNIDESKIEKAITPKTKAVVPVHYAGVGCDMDKITKIAQKYNLLVIEDAAQGLMSYYNKKPLGSYGHIAAVSFHETKDVFCGEGGALLINDPRFIERAEVIWEKGTNRNKYYKGQVDKYTWVDIGSSYLMSEINAAFLFAQFECATRIKDNRIKSWNYYFELLKLLKDKGHIDIPFIPRECRHNAHMFYIKVKDLKERNNLISYLNRHGVNAVFHYVPLHSSEAGKKYGRFNGTDHNTTKESERVIRLPMFYGLKKEQIVDIVDKIGEFCAKTCFNNQVK